MVTTSSVGKASSEATASPTDGYGTPPANSSKTDPTPKASANLKPGTPRTTLRTMSRAAQFSFGQRLLMGSEDAPLDGLEALKQAANRRDAQMAARSPLTQQTIAPLRSSPLSLEHAAPLSPLRDRDVLALSEWFQREDMGTIEADVAHCLLVLLPAPCWEDDPFEFLNEFL